MVAGLRLPESQESHSTQNNFEIRWHSVPKCDVQQKSVLHPKGLSIAFISLVIMCGGWSMCWSRFMSGGKIQPALGFWWFNYLVDFDRCVMCCFIAAQRKQMVHFQSRCHYYAFQNLLSPFRKAQGHGNDLDRIWWSCSEPGISEPLVDFLTMWSFRQTLVGGSCQKVGLAFRVPFALRLAPKDQLPRILVPLSRRRNFIAGFGPYSLFSSEALCHSTK